MNNSEKHTVSKMILIYCKSKHKVKDSALCMECAELEAYAHKRLEGCCFGEDKPNCKDCLVHCYKPYKRVQVQKVMRFAGPRMMYKYPILTLKHLYRFLCMRKISPQR